MKRARYVAVSITLAISLGCGRAAPLPTEAGGLSADLRAGASKLPPDLQLPVIDLEKLTDETECELQMLDQASNTRSMPGLADAALEYRQFADHALEKLATLHASLQPFAHAIAQGNISQLAPGAQALLDEVESVRSMVESTGQARDAAMAMLVADPQMPATAEPLPPDDESFWDQLLQVLEFIARILSYVILIFGSGSDAGSQTATHVGGATAMQPVGSSLDTANSDGQGLIEISRTAGRDLVRLSGDGKSILLAAEGDVDSARRLSLPLDHESDLPQWLKAGMAAVVEVRRSQADYPIEIRLELEDGRKIDLKWDEPDSPVVVHGTN